MKTTMQRRNWLIWPAALLLAGWLPLGVAQSAQEGPDELIQRIASDVLNIVKNDAQIQAGNIDRIVALVDERIMPHVNFRRMTSSAVGRYWRQATPEQQSKLQQEFKILLVRTYSGALSQIKDQSLALRPMRSQPGDAEVVVRSEVRGKGEPIQLDYRLEKTPAGWKIYDLNVLGVWLVETYRTQFSQEIHAKGIDGLIAALVERNRSNAAKAG